MRVRPATLALVSLVVGIAVVSLVLIKERPNDPANEKRVNQTESVTDNGMNVTVYKSSSCNCCGNYVAYLKRRGLNVETVNTQDLSGIKSANGVPRDVQSCHTTLIGDYTVEGHVPIEAIEKLLNERPPIEGIALPDMPAGSPGMPGAKQGPFDIRGFTADGTLSSFMLL